MGWTLLEERGSLGDLLKELRQEVSTDPSPTALRVYGSVRAVLSGTVPEEVLVDDWPKWEVLIVRPPSAQEQPEHLLRTVSIHCRRASSLDTAVCIQDVIDWTRPCIFACLPLQTAAILTGQVGGHGSMTKLIDCDTLLQRDEISLERPVPVPPEPYVTTTVLPSMADAVVSHWRQNMSPQTTFCDPAAAARLVEFNCTHFPSSCIADVNGRPAAHVLCHYYGAVGMLGLSRDHKGRGLAALVLRDLCGKLAEAAQPRWAHIERGNAAAAELFVRAGFTPLRGAATVWLEYTPRQGGERAGARAGPAGTARVEGGAPGPASTPTKLGSPTSAATLGADYF